MTTFEIVVKAIADRVGLDVAAITAETDVREDLGMDSLDAVELIMELEEELGISMPADKTADLKTVGEIAALAESLSK
ncbi:MAG: acyl carrier protein [Clostridiales bacterium]|nr:acyl carrier protein [Clostridiales bacterium]